MRSLALAVLVSLLPLSAVAQEAQEREPLVTDRPDVAESALTVGSGTVQIESGVLYERFRDGEADRVSVPTLLRFGTGPDTELRLEGDGPTFQGADRGLSDVSFGAKVNLTDGNPAVGILASVQFPSGARAFRGNAAVPEVKLLLDADLDDTWGLGFNAGVALPQDPTGPRFAQGSFALAVGPQITDRVRIYGEVFGAGPEAVGGETFLAVDGGVTYLVHPDLQLDLAVLRGLSAGGLDWGVTVGVGARF